MSGVGGTLARLERARRVAEARARGDEWAVIAEREGISLATAKRDVQAFVEAGSPGAVLVGDTIHAEAAVSRVIAAHLKALSAAERALDTGANESARVGAVKATVAAGVSLLATLQGLGLLGNSHLRAFQREIAYAASVIGALAEEHDIPHEDVEAALDRVRRGPIRFDAHDLPELLA